MTWMRVMFSAVPLRSDKVTSLSVEFCHLISKSDPTTIVSPAAGVMTLRAVAREDNFEAEVTKGEQV